MLACFLYPPPLKQYESTATAQDSCLGQQNSLVNVAIGSDYEAFPCSIFY